MFYKSVLAALSFAVPVAAAAGTINTLPSNNTGSISDVLVPDAFGGSFFADAPTLTSFSLELRSDDSSVYRAIVMDIISGTPTSVLWESGDQIAPAATTNVVFMPGISLTVGLEYLIAVDAGVETTVASGANIFLGFRNDNPIAGTAFTNFNGALTWSSVAGFDIASEIVMTEAVPVPPPLTLLLAGLGALMAVRRQRSA